MSQAQERVYLIVRNLKGFTKCGQSRKVVSVLPEDIFKNGLHLPIFRKIEYTNYSERQGGYMIRGSLVENLWIFKQDFEIINIIYIN
jgi:hypothetical protein